MAGAAVVADTEEASVPPATPNGKAPILGLIASSFADIASIDDRQYENVPVPEWGLVIRLVSIDGLSRNRMGEEMRKANKTLDDTSALEFQCRLILESMVDADGNHIGDQSQLPVLMAKNNSVIVRLYNVCASLSGVGADAVQEAQEALKETPSVDTGSD